MNEVTFDDIWDRQGEEIRDDYITFIRRNSPIQAVREGSDSAINEALCYEHMLSEFKNYKENEAKWSKVW